MIIFCGVSGLVIPSEARVLACLGLLWWCIIGVVALWLKRSQ